MPDNGEDGKAKHPPSYYHGLIERYLPENIRMVIIAESPPASGLYFYDASGQTSEPLFSELIKVCLCQTYSTKDEGLRAFQEAGFVLLDATYRPVNEMSSGGRNKIVRQDFPNLLKNLERFGASRLTPIGLIKANVCRVLEPLLLDAGWNVVNHGDVVPFPSTGQQGRFRESFPRLLGRAGIEPCEPQVRSGYGDSPPGKSTIGSKRAYKRSDADEQVGSTAVVVAEMQALLYELNLSIGSVFPEAFASIQPDWWQRLVMTALSDQQIAEARRARIQTLFGLDLAANLRVLVRNWRLISQRFGLEKINLSYLREAQDIRNHWMHLSGELPPTEDIARHKDTIARIMKLISLIEERLGLER